MNGPKSLPPQDADGTPPAKSVAALIGEAALRYPGKTAIRFKNQQVTYAEVDQQSNRIAAILLHHGIKNGHIIGVALDRSPEMVIALLGILKSGAAYMPLDTQYPKDRINFMLDDTEASLLLTSRKYMGQFGDRGPSDRGPFRELLLEDMGELRPGDADRLPGAAASGSDLAYILYTSGSTGKPKGVMVEHRGLANVLLSMQQMPGLGAEDKLLAVSTISFDIAAIELFLPLITGAELVLADTTESKDGRLLLEMVRKENISFMQATQSTWKMMLDSGWDEPLDLKVLVGGEPLSNDLVRRLIPRCSALFNMYGPTETTICSTGGRISSPEEPITIGRPIRHTRVYILDEHLRPLPTGETGEIYISGDGVAKGYLHRPQLTAERFVHDPFSEEPGARMFRSGDRGRLLPDGKIQCLGRVDTQVKIRGYRIEPGEIEYALIGQTDIKEAIVLAYEDVSGDQRLAAYILPDGLSMQEAESRPAAWKAALKASLPDYMVPPEYIVLDAFPVTLTGKIDRNALPRPSANREADTAAEPFAPPRTVGEKLVSAIWTDLLKINRISIHSDFFELGGHSLIALNVLIALEKETGRRLPLATLFENATIEKLARMITIDEKEIKWDALVPIKVSGTKTPIYLVHGAGLNVLTFKGLEKFMAKDQPLYALQALGLNGKSKLFYSIEEIAEKYNEEILANNPDGPYALAGYSLGGIIAYEMARQLLRMGKEVQMLGIMDTYAGKRNIQEPAYGKASRKVIRQFRKLAFFSGSFLKQPKEVIAYQSYIIGSMLRKAFSPGGKNEMDYFTYHEEEVNRSYYTAVNNYWMDPAPLDIEIDLFRVQKRINFLDDRVLLGWKDFAKGVKVYEVPGDHKTFLFPPNNGELARVLQNALDNRRSAGERKDTMALKTAG